MENGKKKDYREEELHMEQLTEAAEGGGSD